MRRSMLLAALFAGAAQAATVTTEHGVEAAIATSLTAGRPVVLEFTADWCAGCKELRATLAEPAVKQRLNCATLIVVDLTASPREAALRKLSQRYRLDGLPTVAFLDRDGTEHEDLRLTGVPSARELQTGLAGVCS